MPRPVVRLALVMMLVAGSASAQTSDDEFFEKSVRPVLVERCVGCHGAKAKKGGLRLDTREGVLAGGDDGAVVVPDKPAKSRLVDAVKHAGKLKMPEKKLPDAEIAALEKWVQLGVPWPAKVKLVPPERATDHWAYRPVSRAVVPSSEFRVPSANPIDAFIQARLEKAKLILSPEADRRTLLRRVTFDLTGLPPTPAELEAFLKDDSKDAYEKAVDRLLKSERYGERWGRHWLDVARYADNKGYVFFEQKEYPWAWTYRDYVIDAFNRDLPFDRFVLEQLAADQLKLDDPKSLAALGFLTVGGHFMGNVHDIIDDRIDVMTRGLMGLTVSCARCHDHKFDPIPTADYYSLYGVFRSCTEPMVPPLWGKPGESEEAKKQAAELAAKEKALTDFVVAKHTELVMQARTRAAEYLLAAHAARDVPPSDDFMLIADKGDLNPAMTTRWRAFLERTRKAKDSTWALWHRFADTPEADFGNVRLTDTDNPRVRAAFATPPKTMKEVAERYGKLLSEVETEWKKAGGKDPLTDPAAEALRAAFYGPTAPADAPLALDWGFLSLFPDRATQGEYQKLIKEVEVSAAKGPPRAMVLLDADRPHDARVFLRGNPNRLGEEVPRQFLQAVDPNRKPFATGSGRLELAKAIASKENPLTARVFVNRVWMHHFGKGIVGTPGDFGVRGDPPTHPELLDWLAAELMSPSPLEGEGLGVRGTGKPIPWSVKHIHRLIVTSAAYKQASADRDDGRTVDPENLLLWKQNRRRLEFEPLHDAMLGVSGNLDLKAGGPSVPLFSGKTRRAVYGSIDRLEFPSLLATFDVPNPAATSPERTNTTVSPQALYLMNGPFARDAAKKLLAAPAVKDAETPAVKLDALYLACFARTPTEKERERLLAFVAKGPEAEKWLDLAHALLMSNEFVFVD